MSYITPEQAAKARLSLNLSQAKVAADTGINRPYISQFEGGKRVLEDQLLETLTKYYETHGWAPILPDKDKTIAPEKVESVLKEKLEPTEKALGSAQEKKRFSLFKEPEKVVASKTAPKPAQGKKRFSLFKEPEKVVTPEEVPESVQEKKRFSLFK